LHLISLHGANVRRTDDQQIRGPRAAMDQQPRLDAPTMR
jgi:hypothetical protein